MKALSIGTLAAVLLLAASGCIAQAGTDTSSSSSEELNAEPNTVEAQQQLPTTEANVRTRDGVTRQRLKNGVTPGEDTDDVELSGPNSGPNNNPGDPVQDPGDGTEPDPHPWHSSTATIAK